MNRSYTDEENSVFIGKTEKHRKLMNKRSSSKISAEQCAQDIIDDNYDSYDNYGYYEDLKSRGSVALPTALDKFRQHVERIDKVVAGKSN